MITSNPALATAAPTIPPTSACDDDDGSPRIAVTTFQTIAPTSPAKITPIDSTSWSTTSVGDRRRHRGAEDEEGEEVERGRPHHGRERRQHPGRDDGRDRVGGVVETVDEVEQQGDRDDEPEQDVGHRQACFTAIVATR